MKKDFHVAGKIAPWVKETVSNTSMKTRGANSSHVSPQCQHWQLREADQGSSLSDHASGDRETVNIGFNRRSHLRGIRQIPEIFLCASVAHTVTPHTHTYHIHTHVFV